MSAFIGAGFAGSLEACVSATVVVAVTGVPALPLRRCASALTISLPSEIPARSWNAMVLVPAASAGRVHVSTGPVGESVDVGSGNGAALPATYTKSAGTAAVTTTSCRLPLPSSVTTSVAV